MKRIKIIYHKSLEADVFTDNYKRILVIFYFPLSVKMYDFLRSNGLGLLMNEPMNIYM